jgi:hypothetical protein
MAIYDVPVAPYLNPDGSIASLSNILPSQPIPAAPPPSPPYNFSVVNVNSVQMSASMASDIGFGDLVNINVSGSVLYFLLDLIATLPAIPVQSDPVTEQVYGVGVRVALKTWNFNSKFTANAGMVAASATLSMASTAFEATVIGPGIGSLTALEPLLQSSLSSSFDVTTMQNLGQAVAGLADYMATNSQNLTPSLLGVNLNFSSNTLLAPTGSYIFALRQITKGQSYNQAIQNLPSTPPPDTQLNATLIQAVYTQLVGQDPTTTPTSDDKTMANLILNVGS